MAAFAQAVQGQMTTTTNGMAAYASSLNKNVDLFFKIGASRGKDIVPDFTAAFVENPDLALRIAQWSRDVRGGAGERQIFLDILLHLEKTDVAAAKRLLLNTPEIGRWKDLLVVTEPSLKAVAFTLIKGALESGNGLCAKWMPRKGKIAEDLRAFLGYSPKRYRKTLVTLTKVVESQMCAKDWENIEFGHVPSIAAARYKKAFARNAPVEYSEYVNNLNNGTAKINAGAIFPYDVLREVFQYRVETQQQRDVIVAQWAALPNFVGDSKVLPLVDVSGSMECSLGGNGAKGVGLTCMQVAISLGLYLADKNTGPFKDTFLTFSSKPQLLHLKGNVVDKYSQMANADWGGDTNLTAAFDRILDVARQHKVSQDDMPDTLVVLSDMQFNQADRNMNDTAIEMIRKRYDAAGYKMPKLVFWNLHAHDNVPARANDNGVALVSGFSPAIMKAVLAGKSFTPMDIMLDAVMIDRYAA